MNELSVVLNTIEKALNTSIDSLVGFQEFQEQVRLELAPLMANTPSGQNMFFLSSAFDSMKCLLEVEIEENRRLSVSHQKAKQLVEKDVFGPVLAMRLQDLSNVDAAVHDGDFSRYVTGLLSNQLDIDLTDFDMIYEKGNWGEWCLRLEKFDRLFTQIAEKIPATHPLAPTMGLTINMLNSIHVWCEEQRRIQVAIDVLSQPQEYSGPDYGSFLRLELLELRRKLVRLPREEEE
jgi:hypothetical protein